jgi:hypothetical protein
VNVEMKTMNNKEETDGEQDGDEESTSDESLFE